MKKLVFLVSVIFVSNFAFAQKLTPEFSGASHKKTAYITLDDGTELKGNIKDLDYKKGLIEQVKMKDLDGKKIKIKPEQIKHMYIPSSAFGKLAKLWETTFDATKWASTDIDNDIINKGYFYFEKSEVKIKKKTKVLMLQLRNPSFGSKIKIYHDPYAKETASVGVAGIKVAGGIDKSYYVKKGDEPAYKLKKKDYDEEFKMFYSDCKTLVDKYGASPKWKDFVTHVFEYTKDCK
jgi:hypothetical protein